MYLQNRHGLFHIPPAHFHPLPSMNIPDRKSSPKPDTQFHQSPFISCHPKGGMSACVRIDQKISTKKPDLFSQTRPKMVEVTGFEPATFWSRKLTLFDQCESDYPSLSTIDRICSDRKAPSVGEFALQTTRLKEPAIMDNRFVISHRFSCSIPRVRCHA